MMRYEPHIDGLRAIAVVSVIIYHANFTLYGGNAIQNGYLGVDVFFVISGYLITALLLAEHSKSGRIDLPSFLARRARRIFPALVVVILACIPFVAYVSNETQALEFRNSVLAALLGSSNFYFWLTTTDYDAGNSQLLPLLHTWSLGIELQFYALFPILIVAFLKLPRLMLWLFVIGAFAASLTFALLLSERNPDLAFFLSPTRFWEMLAGSIAAILLGKHRALGISDRSYVAIASIAIVVLLSTFFVSVSGLDHPGLATLPTILATLALLITGDRTGPVFWLLTLKPIAWIGKVSYSAYLWHFPLLAFARQSVVEPDHTTKAAIIIVTFVLSAITYRFVEMPYRNAKIISNASALKWFVSSTTISAVIAAALANQSINAKIPKLLDAIDGNIKASFDIRRMHTKAQEFSLQRTEFHDLSLLNVLVVGNSHSRNIFNAFEHNRHLWPHAEFLRISMQLVCFDPSRTKDRTLADSFFRSEEFKVADVIVVATRFRHRRTCDGMNTRWMIEDKGVSELLEKARAAGKKLVVFGPIPEFGGGDVDLTIYGPLRTNLIYGRRDRLETDTDFARKIVEGINKAAFRRVTDLTAIASSIQTIAASFDAEYVDLTSLVCNEAKGICSAMTDKSERTYADTNHLTLEGSFELGEKLASSGLPRTLREAAR